MTPVQPLTHRADQAARRFDGFLNRWFLDPLYGRGYPVRHARAVRRDRFVLNSDFESDLANDRGTDRFSGRQPLQPAQHRRQLERCVAWRRRSQTARAVVTQMGWVVQPASLFDLLRDLASRYPVGHLAVTENGAAYPDPSPSDGRVADDDRTQYPIEHVAVAERAVAAGVPLSGYWVRSLLDYP